MQYREFDGSGQIFVDFQFDPPVQILPQVPTCKVANTLVDVPLGTVLAKTFTGVGAVSPEKSFNLSLNCSGGLAGTSTRPFVTLTDNTDKGNVSTQLSLTSQSTASGIAIQILRGGDPLGYGPDSSAVGNTNQWSAGTIGHDVATYDIPLSARYMQTGAAVGMGTANGQATFTMSYQ